MKKRGMELTISTLVVIILALMMLVMGTIITRAMTCNAMQGVNSMAELGQQEIQNLFSQQEDNNVAVKEKINDIQRVTYYGVGFFIKNVDIISNNTFTYTVDVFDLQDCDITKAQARDYILSTRTKSVNIVKGNTYSDILEMKIPQDAPICSLKYEIKVENGGQLYSSTVFTVRIKEASFFRNLLC